MLENIKPEFFIFIVLGSYVKKAKNPKDIDILVIIENPKDINNIEKSLYNIASNFNVKFDINVISTESVYEMLSKGTNIMTEILNSHIILFGAENFYKILKNAR